MVLQPSRAVLARVQLYDTAVRTAVRTRVRTVARRQGLAGGGWVGLYIPKEPQNYPKLDIVRVPVLNYPVHARVIVYRYR
eukprot:SAG31_NODE_1960_length_6804_cov_3.421626_6_plen_80_part_00